MTGPLLPPTAVMSRPGRARGCTSETLTPARSQTIAQPGAEGKP
jgi:hypothetical protein